jgi:hypothetical protein
MTKKNVDVVQETTSMIGSLQPMVDRVKKAVSPYHV